MNSLFIRDPNQHVTTQPWPKLSNFFESSVNIFDTRFEFSVNIFDSRFGFIVLGVP